MQAIDPGRHEYRLKDTPRRTNLLFGLILIGSGIFFTWETWTQTDSAIFALMPAVIQLGPGLYLLVLALRSRLVIDGSRIAMRGAIREHSVDLSEVEGFRNVRMPSASGGYTILKLEMKQGKRTLIIRQWLDCDELRAWLKQLPDLDLRDRQELLTEIQQDRELGATPEERLKKWRRAKWWNIALTAVAITAAIVAIAAAGKWRWGAAIILALIPAAVLFLLNRQPLLFALTAWQKNPRSNLWIATLVAGMGLTFCGIGTSFVSLAALVPSTIIATLAFLLGFYMLGRKKPQDWVFHLLVAVCGISYGFGLMATCDTLLDHAKATTYEVQVAGLHTNPAGESTDYFLDFGPWGPLRSANSVSVSQDEYQRTHAGDVVCFDVRPGLVHAAWYERTTCATASALPGQHWGSPATP